MSTSSSVTTPKPSPSLGDVIRALEKRGRHEEAEKYGFFFPLMVMILHDITEEEALSMPLDALLRLIKLPPKPLKYDEWNFHWGKSAYAYDR